MPDYRIHDPLRDALRAHGCCVTDHHLSDHPGSMYIGPRFRIRHCEMIYRRPEPDLLLIVLYRRQAEKTGTLGNPFADLVWFLQMCTQPEFELNRIMGYISTYHYRHENGLSNLRLTRFYQRFFDAHSVEYDGNLWLCQSVQSLRIRLAQIPHKAIKMQSSIARLSNQNRLSKDNFNSI